MSEVEPDQPSNQSSVRWQEQSVSQLSFAINLFVGLGTASLGLAFGWMTGDKPVTGGAKCLLLWGVGLMLVSLFSGCAATITRLLDFRTTAEVARQREGGATKQELAALRSSMHNFSKASWRLFWLEISSFLCGVLFLVASVMCAS